MKPLLSFILIIVVSSIYSQERLKQANDTTFTKLNTYEEVEAFQPHVKLLNTSIWNRVSANRFECDFLRLAVELRNHEYWLLEMDGQKRLLARHEQYAVISHVIVHLTLRRTPNWIEYENLKSKPAEDHYLKIMFLYYVRYHLGLSRFSF